MGDCEHIREMMEAYIDGELSAGERSSLEAHIAVCNSCRAALEKEKSLLNALHAVATVPAPEALRIRVMARLRAEMPVLRKSPAAGFLQSIFASRGLNYAYTAALTILVIFLGIRLLHQPAQRRGGIMRLSDEFSERMPAVSAPLAPSAPASAPVPRKVAAFLKGAPEEIIAGDKAEYMRRAVPINELLRQYGAETVSISKELPEKRETKYVFLLPSERYADFERGIRGRNVKILKVSELPASAALLQKKAAGHLGVAYEMKSLEAPSTPSPVTTGVTVAAGGAAVNEGQLLEKKGVEAAPQVAAGVSPSRGVDVAAARPAKTDRSRVLGLKEPEMEKAKDVVRKPSSLANALENYYVDEEGKKPEKAGRERIQTLGKGGVTLTTSTLSLGYYTPAIKQPTEGAMKIKPSYYYIEMLVGQTFTYDPTNGTITTGDISRIKQ
ncbi:MAG: zf-HC2 domain-containing protein [Candidatus Sumerlaeota bacterium]|nr:zf-HC2 domain-containing protein [Candidatus Sumerlaeota bacterium]